MENLWKILLSIFLDISEVSKSRVCESKPQLYSWNVRNSVSSLCRIMCGCPLEIPGNTLVWNSCGGGESSDLRAKKSITKSQEIGLYCMQDHEEEAWRKYLLPVWVLVIALGFMFGMLEKNFSMLSEVVQTGIGQKTWETTGDCSDLLTATSCTWAYSAWAWNCDLGSPRSRPAAHGLWPLHPSLSFHQVFSCKKYIFQSRLLATSGRGKWKWLEFLSFL